MKHLRLFLIGMILVLFHATVCQSATDDGKSTSGTANITDNTSTDLTRAQVSLTVAESKRLIARGFKRLPEVQRALKEGRILVALGTTNTYIAEELVGRKIEHGAFVIGQILPLVGAPQNRAGRSMGPVFLDKGQEISGLSLSEAFEKMGPGDLIVKGGNALDYQKGLVATLIGSDTGGTSGEILSHLKSKELRLVIPIGLEKQIAGDLRESVRLIKQPIEGLSSTPTMVLWTDALIVTEIEALQTAAKVKVVQIAAGGIGGAEGSVRLLIQGPRDQVNLALDEVHAVRGEPPFYPQTEATGTNR